MLKANEMQNLANSVNTVDLSNENTLIDYGFYLIQRGNAGHLRNGFQEEYNSINSPEHTVAEHDAVNLAKREAAESITSVCRAKFKDFGSLLPCYKAVILDMAVQGDWSSIQNAMNEGNLQNVYETVLKNLNKERAAVRARAIEMGMLIEQIRSQYPQQDPKAAASVLADYMISKYKNLNGSDCELTKDELALLYRSCMAAYNMPVSDNEIESFILKYTQVAGGFKSAGNENMSMPLRQSVQSGVPYVGSWRQNGGYNGGYNSLSSRYSARYASGAIYTAPTKSYYERVPFNANSQDLVIRRDFASPNYGSRNGRTPQMIVLHSTESPSLSVTMNTFQASSGKTSAHYVIDRDGTIYQLVPEELKANHAGVSSWSPLGITGSCNTASIGIEIQRGENEGFTREQIASAMALVKDIKSRWGISKENVVGHSDIAPGRKVDPGYDFPWEAFEAENLANGPEKHIIFDSHKANFCEALNSVSSSECRFYNYANVAQTTDNVKENTLSEMLKSAEVTLDAEKVFALLEKNKVLQEKEPAQSFVSKTAGETSRKMTQTKSLKDQANDIFDNKTGTDKALMAFSKGPVQNKESSDNEKQSAKSTRSAKEMT